MIIRIPISALSDVRLSVEQLALNVSRNSYGGNLTVDVETARRTSRSDSYRVKIGAGAGGPGSRRSPSGRRGPWACWHAFRDVLTAVFDEYPDAVAHTAFVTYRGRDGFERDFPATAWKEVRGGGYTEYFSELCDCDETE